MIAFRFPLLHRLLRATRPSLATSFFVPALLVVALVASDARADSPLRPYEDADEARRARFTGAASLEGRLTWCDGSPAAGVPIDLVAYAPEQAPWRVREARTDAEGRYRFEGILGKSARYRVFLQEDPLQRTFYVFVPKLDARVSHDHAFQPRVGDPAPPLELPVFAGAGAAGGAGARPVAGNDSGVPPVPTLDLPSLAGRVVVLKFWATWCGPCHGEMTEVADLIRRRPDWNGRVAFVGVNCDPKRQDATRFLEERDLLGRMIHAGREGAKLEAVRASGFRIDSLPMTFVLDSKGVVRHRSDVSTDLESVVTKLLAETP